MKTFKPYNPDQPFLLPPVLQEWLPEDHPAAFISEVVDEAVNLTPILATYETGDGRGQPLYHPALLVKLLLYGFGTGKPFSRQIEQATYEEIPYRVLAASQHRTTTPSPPSSRPTSRPSPPCSPRCSGSASGPGWCSSGTWPSMARRASPTPPSTRR